MKCFFFMNFGYIEHYGASVGDELIQANELFFFMNFGYIEHYGASVADNLEAKRN